MMIDAMAEEGSLSEATAKTIKELFSEIGYMTGMEKQPEGMSEEELITLLSAAPQIHHTIITNRGGNRAMRGWFADTGRSRNGAKLFHVGDEDETLVYQHPSHGVYTVTTSFSIPDGLPLFEVR